MQSAEAWLKQEEEACEAQRVERLAWIASIAPPAEIWTFSGGWLNHQLFEEARYSYVYGQFIASSVLAFAFIERTLAALFYWSGRNDLRRATSKDLVAEAVKVGLLSEEEATAFEHARELRNPLVHFRRPMDNALPDVRAFHQETTPSDVIERDARVILGAMFRLVEKQAVG